MKKSISKQEQQQTEDFAKASKELLENERFQFIRDYFNSATNYIEQSVLNNTIRDVSESVTISERIKKTFSISKKIQVDELSGQYKFIKKFLRDLQYYVDTYKQLEKAIEEKKVLIEK